MLKRQLDFQSNLILLIKYNEKLFLMTTIMNLKCYKVDKFKLCNDFLKCVCPFRVINNFFDLDKLMNFKIKVDIFLLQIHPIEQFLMIKIKMIFYHPNDHCEVFLKRINRSELNRIVLLNLFRLLKKKVI